MGQSFLFDVQRIKGCAVEQGAVCGPYCVDDAIGGEKNQSVILTDVECVGIVHDIVKHIAMSVNDTLWLPGRARDVKNAGKAIG